jgi:hypothetical protein
MARYFVGGSPTARQAEPKARRRARASPRGGVYRAPNPKLRGDEQKPDMRRGASGASGHVTAKPSICGNKMYFVPRDFLRSYIRRLCREGNASYPGRYPRCFGAMKLGVRQRTPNTVEKSAEGVVGGRQATLVRHCNVERRRPGYARAATLPTEGPNGAPRGD